MKSALAWHVVCALFNGQHPLRAAAGASGGMSMMLLSLVTLSHL